MSSTAKKVFFWFGNAVFFTIFLVFGLNFGIAEPFDGSHEFGMGPSTWPFVVVVILVLVSCALTWASYVHHKRVSAHTENLQEDDGDAEYNSRRLLLTLGCMFSYYFSVPWLGIAAASSLFCFIFIVSSGEKLWYIALPIPIITSVGLYYFFYYVAKIPLPTGPFGGII